MKCFSSEENSIGVSKKNRIIIKVHTSWTGFPKHQQKKKKKPIADIMAIYYKQDMDTQLKTLIIRNFKWLHPTDLKILVITF